MRVQFLLEVCLSPSWLVVWQLCWYSHRSPFSLQNTGESFLYYLNALRIESVLVMLFTDPKNMLGFKFNLYMSPCFGGSWIALTLCNSSHAVMWFCHMLSLESQFHDSPVCIPSQPILHTLIAPSAGAMLVSLSITVFRKTDFVTSLRNVFAAQCKVWAVGLERICKAFWGSSRKTEMSWKSGEFLSW